MYWTFQNVFMLDFGHFQHLNIVKGGTNSCDLHVILKLKIMFAFSNNWHFLCLRLRCSTKRRTQKLGQHILHYVSKF